MHNWTAIAIDIVLVQLGCTFAQLVGLVNLLCPSMVLCCCNHNLIVVF